MRVALQLVPLCPVTSVSITCLLFITILIRINSGSINQHQLNQHINLLEILFIFLQTEMHKIVKHGQLNVLFLFPWDLNYLNSSRQVFCCLDQFNRHGIHPFLCAQLVLHLPIFISLLSSSGFGNLSSDHPVVILSLYPIKCHILFKITHDLMWSCQLVKGLSCYWQCNTRISNEADDSDLCLFQ